MKRNKGGDAEDFESSEETDASDNERQPVWHDAEASPFERPPRRSSAYPKNEHQGDHKGGRGYERAHTDSGRGNYSSRDEGRLMPIDADVLAYFPDPGAINQALRALIPIIDARGARGARDARHAHSSPRSAHYGESRAGYTGRSASAEAFGRAGGEHQKGAYRAKPQYAEGRPARDAFPFGRGPRHGYTGRSASSSAPRADRTPGYTGQHGFPPDRPPFARKRPKGT